LPSLKSARHLAAIINDGPREEPCQLSKKFILWVPRVVLFLFSHFLSF
jgi:hypothetical protein